ncbi:hypothetical protein AAF712_016327, partial [Marasmius tenuissimus]
MNEQSTLQQRLESVHQQTFQHIRRCHHYLPHGTVHDRYHLNEHWIQLLGRFQPSQIRRLASNADLVSHKHAAEYQNTTFFNPNTSQFGKHAERSGEDEDIGRSFGGPVFRKPASRRSTPKPSRAPVVF